jgi:CDP-diglyceride synthetase
MKKFLFALAVWVVVIFAAWPWLEAASQMVRIRALMGAVSAGVFLITLLAIRSYKLREKYAVLWLATAVMITLTAIFPHIVDKARVWFGMQYVTSVVAVVFTFLVLVSFHFSIALSALNDKAASTASRCAILEARIHELERRLGLIPPASKEGKDEQGPAAGR